MKNLVSDEFVVPEILETDKFRLRMLSIHDVVKDFDAVMTSIEYLQLTKPFGPKHNWPKSDLSFEQDLIDLAWHQKEFQRRSSFAYTVMNLDESICLGCIYIFPSSNTKFDSEITMWVRSSEKDSGLDQELFETVKNWISEKWEFENPGYPGRDISWDEWYGLESIKE